MPPYGKMAYAGEEIRSLIASTRAVAQPPYQPPGNAERRNTPPNRRCSLVRPTKLNIAEVFFACFIRRTLILAIALAMSLSASLASAQVSPAETAESRSQGTRRDLFPAVEDSQSIDCQKRNSPFLSISAVLLELTPRSRRRPIRAVWSSSAFRIA